MSCSKSISIGANNPADIADLRPVEIEHDNCDLASSSAERIDLNGDNIPDQVIVRAGGKPVCMAVDLNFDGKVDRYTYFDGNGQIRRIETDYDRDGRIDEIATYVNGVIVRKDREMNLDGKLDTWVVYKNGVLVKQERDADGDGKVDQWWVYPDPTKPECAVVSKDVNGDGLPDVGPEAEFDICKAAEEELQQAAAAAGIEPAASSSSSAAPAPPEPPAASAPASAEPPAAPSTH